MQESLKRIVDSTMAKWPSHVYMCMEAFFGIEVATLPQAGFSMRTSLVARTVHTYLAGSNCCPGAHECLKQQFQLILNLTGVCQPQTEVWDSFSLAFCHLVRLASLTVTAEHITSYSGFNNIAFYNNCHQVICINTVAAV